MIYVAKGLFVRRFSPNRAIQVREALTASQGQGKHIPRKESIHQIQIHGDMTGTDKDEAGNPIQKDRPESGILPIHFLRSGFPQHQCSSGYAVGANGSGFARKGALALPDGFLVCSKRLPQMVSVQTFAQRVRLAVFRQKVGLRQIG